MTELNDEEVLRRLTTFRQFQQDGMRVPHKPLLVLLALGRLQETGSSAVPWSIAETQLADLITEFGPPSTTRPAQSAAYPFTRLRRDNIWHLDADVLYDRVTPLREHGVTGRLEESLEVALRAKPQLARQAARRLVETHFPITVAPDVLTAAGFDPETVITSVVSIDEPAESRTRSSRWRQMIIAAWDRQCAFCGYDGQLAGAVVGIEAAHVQWFNLGGPDSDDNGMALCSIHHKLFDRGALGLDENHHIQVSGLYSARTDAARRVYDLHDQPLTPRRGTALPAMDFISWHSRQVFKGKSLSI